MQSGSAQRFALKTTAALLAVLLLAGILFEQIGERADRRRYPQVGRSVAIGGRTLNLYCSGQGRPTVVFETYGHMAGYSWSALQSEVAKSTRACWYDRAGYGWSDPAPGEPRTFREVEADLHALLHAAGEPGPYVLVGARDAALEIRVFHGLYPAEVAGVVMVSPNDVDDAQEIPESARGAWAKHFGAFAPRVRRAACVAFPAISGVGLLRLAWMVQGARRTLNWDLTPDEQTELDFLSDNPTAERSGSVCTREENMDQVRAAGNLGDVPLVVVASGEPFASRNHAEAAVAAAWNRHQLDDVQPGLARLSTRGRLERIDGGVTSSEILGAIREVAAAH